MRCVDVRMVAATILARGDPLRFALPAAGISSQNARRPHDLPAMGKVNGGK
jgi:hypothetical protein